MRGVRSDMGVIFLSGADAPREAIPQETLFIRKNETQPLVETVIG